MQPSKIKPGQEITAQFLNYCRDGVAAFGTMDQGDQDGELGRHNVPALNKSVCTFLSENDVVVPPNSVFVLEQVDTPLDPATQEPSVKIAQYTGSIKSSLYTNYEQQLNAGSERYNFLVEFGSLYLLQCNPAALPAAGDNAGPTAGSWEVSKGGIHFLCVSEPDVDGLAYFLALPASSSKQAVGGVTNNDIEARTTGEVELYDKDDVPNGTIVTVFNPHDITFYKENTTSGEEAPADRVILFEVDGWLEPLILPFMLSECVTIDPDFEPVDV